MINENKNPSPPFWRSLILLFGINLMVASTAFALSLESLPVQEGGRVKPYDTFAREQLSLLWGRETYKKQPATHVVLSWMLAPDIWDDAEFMLIRHNGLREAMNLDKKRLYYKPSEIMANDRLGLLVQELKNKVQAEEKLDPFYQAVQTLEAQLSSYHAMKLGLILRIWPSEKPDGTWLSVSDLPAEPAEKFQNVVSAFLKTLSASKSEDKKSIEAASSDLEKSLNEFTALAQSQYPHYEVDGKIRAEVHYNTSHPFRTSWIAYLIALIFFSFAYFGRTNRWLKVAWVGLAVGMFFHMWGFALRIYILDRPPVTNMFETVAWVALVSLIFSLIFYGIYRAKILLVAATLVATFSLILCDISSTVLDDALTPLQPVLRDNFWLLTHVIIIVSSYAAFFLAFFIGDVMLFYYLKDEKKYQSEIQEGALSIYRSIQVGVVLLAAGTILGGVWADYSWGRFWGWDPKETWAFIALLGYLVILHGKIIGWLRNYGLAAASVVAFSLVIMAWYGVNFVLGAGLHTYGFGAGGVEYVAIFVAIHLLYVAYVTTLRQSRINSEKT